MRPFHKLPNSDNHGGRMWQKSLLWQHVSVGRNEEEELRPHFSPEGLMYSVISVFAQAGRRWISFDQTVCCLVVESCFCCDHEAHTLTDGDSWCACVSCKWHSRWHLLCKQLQQNPACVIILLKYSPSQTLRRCAYSRCFLPVARLIFYFCDVCFLSKHIGWQICLILSRKRPEYQMRGGDGGEPDNSASNHRQYEQRRPPVSCQGCPELALIYVIFDF